MDLDPRHLQVRQAGDPPMHISLLNDIYGISSIHPCVYFVSAIIIQGLREVRVKARRPMRLSQ